ncbi:hypothetical protein, partial [Micrococcus sp. R8502A1]|uniref:hypothetical protein n=1 Tax=Micrococcus sp. R8502A1 TaxID=2583239 RepID=UPI001C671D53
MPENGPMRPVPPLSLLNISEPTGRSYLSYAVFFLKKKKKEGNGQTLTVAREKDGHLDDGDNNQLRLLGT